MPKELTKAVVTDLLSSLGVPTSTAGELFRRYWARKAAEVQETLLEEIAQGAAPLIAASDDDGVEIVVRVMNASIAGAARINLRLMAKALVGLAQHPPIYASDFAKYQRAVADLSREEIIAVSALYSNFDHALATADPNKPGLVPVNAWQKSVTELVPLVFPTENHFRAAVFAAQRTGLVIVGPYAADEGILRASPLMEEVSQLASFEDALKQEPDPRP